MPIAISVEPPPTSTTASVPARRRVERPRRAVEGEPRLVLAAEDVGLHPGALPQRTRRDRPPLAARADRGRGHDAEPLAAVLVRGPALLGDDLRDDGDRGVGDHPERVEGAADAGERAQLQHLREPGRAGFGHQQPRRVRPDVDAGAAHGNALKVAMMGPCPQRQPSRSRICARTTATTPRSAASRSRVRRGEVFGLLGPNGAGKTTTVEILEGFRERTAGRVAVLGMDPGPRPEALRARVGIVLQAAGLYRHLTVREAVAHWAGLYPRPRDVDETIALTGLEESAGKRTRTLSGGQQRRLDFALALVGDPELVFLDEPTTGFDPAARRQAWETIRSLQRLGKTVLLTTHYLDEAQALADRVAIVKDGAILAEGAPGELGAATRRSRVSWRDEDGGRRSARWRTRPRCCTSSPPPRWRGAGASRTCGSCGRRSRTSTWSSPAA